VLTCGFPVADADSLTLKSEKANAHSNTISSVAFSPDGKTIVSGSWDKMLKVWDSGVLGLKSPFSGRKGRIMLSYAATLELKSEKKNAHDGWVLSVDFDKDGGKVVSGGGDGTIKVWGERFHKPNFSLSTR
jgi:WD40 repeat protein